MSRSYETSEDRYLGLYLKGKVQEDDIHLYIEEWHLNKETKLDLHTYLGMSWSIYSSWEEDSSTLKELKRLYEGKEREEDIKEPILDERLIELGWRCALTDKPQMKTPVLCLVQGLDAPEVLELEWSASKIVELEWDIEGDYIVEGQEDCVYWEAVNHTEFDLNNEVFAWRELPEY